MALETRPAADPIVAPPRRVGAWIALVVVLVVGLSLSARFAPAIVPYLSVEVVG
jgi:hypothetical protein